MLGSEIDCPECRYFAWHDASQAPARVAGAAHHPSCPLVQGGRKEAVREALTEMLRDPEAGRMLRDLRAGRRMLHPALRQSRPIVRVTLIQLMVAEGCDVLCSPDDHHAIVRDHVRDSLATGRGDKWIDLARFLTDPEGFSAARAEQGEVVGGVPETPKPGIVTGAVLESFADAVNEGYESLTRDVNADLGDAIAGTKGPRKLSEQFLKEWLDTVKGWSAQCEIGGSECGIYQLVKQLRAGKLPATMLPSSLWDHVEKYRQLLADFRDRFEGETGKKPTGSLPAGPGWAVGPKDIPGGPILGGNVGDQVKSFAVGAAILAVLGFLLFRKF
jgi:hypothetical protein